jgi:protein-tyrosine phosphatase
LTWTDLHSHILPGFDDGASSDEDFLAMARIAVEGSTSVIVATPHYDHDSPAFTPLEMTSAVQDYRSLLERSGIPLVLVPGMEVRINASLLDLAKAGDLEEFTLGGNGKYMLVELPMLDMPLATLDIFFQIQLCGVTPILAHPERNRHLMENPSVIKDLVERGIVIQVNAGSLEGIFGEKARRMARRLVKEDAARLVASDAHGPSDRSPDLSGAAGALEKLLGARASHVFLEINPALVLEGKELAGSTEATTLKSGLSRKRLSKRLR